MQEWNGTRWGVSHCAVENMPSQEAMGKMTLFYAAVSLLIYNCRVIFASAHDMHVHRCVNVCVHDNPRLQVFGNKAEPG